MWSSNPAMLDTTAGGAGPPAAAVLAQQLAPHAAAAHTWKKQQQQLLSGCAYPVLSIACTSTQQILRHIPPHPPVSSPVRSHAMQQQLRCLASWVSSATHPPVLLLPSCTVCTAAKSDGGEAVHVNMVKLSSLARGALLLSWGQGKRGDPCACMLVPCAATVQCSLPDTWMLAHQLIMTCCN